MNEQAPAVEEKAKEKRKHTVLRGMVGAAALGALGIVGTATWMVVTDDTPNWMFPPEELPVAKSFGGTTLYCPINKPECDTGSALKYSQGYGYTEIKADEVPPSFHKSTIAIEDRTFMSHKGTSGRAVVRATVSNVKNIKPIEGYRIIKETGEFSVGAFFAGSLQGGSTVERQTVAIGNMDQDSNASLKQKLLDQYNETRYAKQLDIDLGCQKDVKKCKEKALLLYYNTVDYGRDTKGVQAASYAYFGKPLDQTTETQQAMLAGMPKHPNSSSFAYIKKPKKGTPEAADAVESLLTLWERTDEVIDDRYNLGSFGTLGSQDAMARRDSMKREMAELFTFEDGKVMSYNDRQRVPNSKLESAVSPFIDYKPAYSRSSANAQDICAMDSVMLAEDEVTKILGHAPEPGSTIVMTTNTKDQKALCDAIQNDQAIMNTKSLDAAAISQAADGGVVAMVGSKDELNQPNFAVGAMKVGGKQQGSGRDAGSTNKLDVLAYAYDHGWTPTADSNGNKLVITKKMTVSGKKGNKDWLIKTGDGCNRLGRKAPCKMTPEEAFAASSNMLPGLVVNEFGSQNIAKKMKILGLPVIDPYNPTFTIGVGAYSPWNKASDYNSFANGGTAVKPHMIDKIIKKDGTEEYNFDKDEKKKGQRAFSQEAARYSIQAMQAVTTYGTAKNLITAPNGTKSFGGKTGTADSSTDLWFDGLACDTKRGSRAISIWAGNPDGNIRITAIDHSYYLAGGVARRYIQNAMTTGTYCDVADLATTER